MANTATLGELKTRTLDYADMKGSDYPEKDRLRDYVNSALADLHDILVNTYEDYFLTKLPIALIGGTEEYALPTDFYKAKKVYFITGDRRFKVEKFNLDDIDGYKDSPISGGSVELWYVPIFTPLQEDDETVDVRVATGWDDFVALSAAVRLLIKEESDPSALMSERDRIKARIIDMAEPRDSGTPDSIGDVYNRWGGYRSYLESEQRSFRYRIMGTNIHFVEIEYIGV